MPKPFTYGSFQIRTVPRVMVPLEFHLDTRQSFAALESSADIALPKRLQERIMESRPQETAVRAQPLIAVRDVRASSRWYQQLLGLDALPEHDHRDVYDRMLCTGGLILQLHAWDEHDHPNLVNAGAAPLGHGVVLWFEVDDFDGVVERARKLRAQIIEEPRFNPAPNHREMWLRDPDGYVVVIASPDGESGS
jgi:catechol 2,3-dioxygenase-like lactoylglutathione lyase family enzyme